MRGHRDPLSENMTHQSPSMVVGVAAKLALRALTERKIAPAPLLRKSGLTVSATEDTRRRIPLVAQARFLEEAAEALGDSALGLHLAEQGNPREFGLLFYAVSAARDVSEGLILLRRYVRIVNDSVKLKITRENEDFEVEVSYPGFPRYQARQLMEFGLAVILRGVREAAGQKVRPTRVSYLHVRNTDLREFERYFGCQVTFGSSANRLIFSDEMMTAPLLSRDPYLLETLRPYCDAAAAERSTVTGTLRASVENEIQRLLPHGQASAQQVAKSLALSARTLSRRLSEEGTSFANTLDQLRRSLAFQYLREPGLTLAQVAYLLGYEATASFNHAFKRWTGKSPSSVRRELTSAQRKAPPVPRPSIPEPA
jgi:AraC-like DNA-binding protein